MECEDVSHPLHEDQYGHETFRSQNVQNESVPLAKF